jgi:hypothetical protein
MSGVVLNPILEHVFRANPAYELAPFDRLPLDQQTLLKDLTKDPDFFGVLLPRTTGGRTIKSVGRDTALLVHAMGQPGPLPTYVKNSLSDHSNQAVAGLVLDGVLEMEHNGRFVSGSEAYPLICTSHPVPEPRGPLSRLSQAALEYAQALGIDDAGRLSTRLYCYNRIPLTPRWSRRLPSPVAVSEFLGISGSTVAQSISRNWVPVERAAPNNTWFQWQSLHNHLAEDPRRPGYKLYVSPQPEALPDAFRAVVEILNDSGAHSFKVGNNSIGVLRPDKLVLYFSEFNSLEQTAHDIALALSGCAVHGVPFTAAIDDNGLLSWGIDPSPGVGALWWQASESWRLWVTNHLAVALISARNSSNSTLQPWQFALERLRLENVDTDTWAPTKNFGRPPA